MKPTWQELINTDQLRKLLKDIYSSGVVYPESHNVLKAFSYFDPKETKVVIIGQDPYHGRGQAHGLAFSVQVGIAPPPSLKNIFKEVESDLGIKLSKDAGNLESWAKQGVLLLNSYLTVEENKPLSHSDKGWEIVSGAVLSELSADPTPKVFMLWGKQAQEQYDRHAVKQSEHLILRAAHPSPLSVKKFLNCKHFSKANEFLKKHGLQPINWQL